MLLELGTSLDQVGLRQRVAVGQHLVGLLEPLQPAASAITYIIYSVHDDHRRHTDSVRFDLHEFLGADHGLHVVLVDEARHALDKDFGRRKVLETFEAQFAVVHRLLVLLVFHIHSHQKARAEYRPVCQ